MNLKTLKLSTVDERIAFALKELEALGMDKKFSIGLEVMFRSFYTKGMLDGVRELKSLLDNK